MKKYLHIRRQRQQASHGSNPLRLGRKTSRK